MDRIVFATGSYGPTPVLGVHGIATYARFFMLKKPVFISVPSFHSPTSRSGPVLRTIPYICVKTNDSLRSLKIRDKIQFEHYVSVIFTYIKVRTDWNIKYNFIKNMEDFEKVNRKNYSNFDLNLIHKISRQF